jgi:nucleotide-binding universal stress UspA family protein
MLERFLVPLDTSTVSEQVLPWVTLLARQLQQPLTLLSVVAESGELNPVASMYDAVIASIMEERRQYARNYLESAQQRLVGQGLTVESEVREGSVAECIVEAATAHGAGLIAMATHGRVGPERWFLGSVADWVVRTASVPVLLVRPHEGTPPPATALEQIVLPLDGSPLAEAALPLASFLARSFGVPISLVRTLSFAWLATGTDPYGVDGGMSPELVAAVEDDAKQYLQQIATRLEGEGIKATATFTLGGPAEEIVDLAAGHPGSLVVMSTHGRSGLGRALLGSVTDRVLRSSVAPVLVVRPPA